MSSEELSLAIAGTGAMAAYHVGRFRGFSGVHIVACYDRRKERASQFAEEHGIPAAYDSMDELLGRESPAAVAVAVADAEHFDVARAVISAGVGLFIEKPLAATLAEAEELRRLRSAVGDSAAAPQAQKAIVAPSVCNFSKLNYPAVFAAVHLLRYGVLGRIETLRLSYLQSWIATTVWGEWWRNPRWLWRISASHGGGGALRDLGSHIFYLSLLILGEGTVERVATELRGSREKAAGSGFSCDLNDTFECELSYPGGVRAVLDGGYANPGHTNNIVLTAECERGTVYVDLEESKNTVFVGSSGEGEGVGKPETVRRYECAKVFSTFDEFVRGMRGDVSLPHWIGAPSLEDGVAVQEMIEVAATRAGAKEDGRGRG